MKKHYIHSLIFLICFAYALVTAIIMMFHNRTPFTLKAVGVKLKQGQVVAISSKTTTVPRKDTIIIDYPQSKAIMPSTLGYIFHNGNEFVLKTTPAISKPSKQQGNYFLPFARTISDGWFEKPLFFGGNETIPQNILKQRGVKFNTAVGSKDNRVSVQFVQHDRDLFVKTNSEGLGAAYLVQSKATNKFQVVFNSTTATDIANVFLFAKSTQVSNQQYYIDINASTFNCNYKVFDSKRQLIHSGSQNNPRFEVNGILFELTPKYRIMDLIWVVLGLSIIAIFQVYFLQLLAQAKSPLIKANITIRTGINNLSLLATPLFLVAMYLTPSRHYYYVSMILLNLSVFAPLKWMDHLLKFKLTTSKTLLLWVFLLGMPVVMYLFTSNENLFGLIPVLHVQKALMLIMLLSTQGEELFKGLKFQYWLRLSFIVAYAFLISFVTSDMGSLIYTFLAFVLIELVKKTISLKKTILIVISIPLVTVLAFNVLYNAISYRKAYRFVAPYITPDDEKLVKFTQGDRETYSTLILNLKNLLNQQTPLFNDLIVPGTMRSTSFSDFAFHWSLSLGQIWFVILFASVIVLMVYDLVLLLFAATRSMRINKDESFVLPRKSESELIRFILGFAIITFTFPIASNFLMLPLTGQSIPALSISIIEPAFLTVLLIPITYIFTNPKYIQPSNQVQYRYYDALRSRAFALFVVGLVFVIGLSIRLFTINQTSSVLSWKKENAEQEINNPTLTSTPDPKNKLELVNVAKRWIGNDELTSVQKDKKPTLKNLASLYYSNRPYNQMYPESGYFVNTAEGLLSQMSVDSIFALKKVLVSDGNSTPFGRVFRFTQRINEKSITKYSNKYYSSIPTGAKSIQPNLTAECAYTLEKHLDKIGDTSKGAIWIVDNQSGAIITNSSIPLTSDKNMAEVHYLIGSLKKILIAYAALKIEPDYAQYTVAGKGFEEAMQTSENAYWASLLREVYQKHPEKLDEILQADFGLPLHSLTRDAYFDALPSTYDNNAPLDSLNLFYRTAIGQQRPYMLRDVIQWYARIAGGLKLRLSYRAEEAKPEQLAFEESERAILVSALNKVLWGSANGVRLALEKHRINTEGIICKTGTAQLSKSQRNSSSSFILCNPRYTIGIMLKGDLPPNDASMGAKHLFAEMIPLFKKYSIL